jgi:hypothetical protein
MLREQAMGLQHVYRRIGYWAALACGVGTVAYGLVSILVGVLAPSALSWEGYEQFTTDYRLWPTMAVLAPPLVVTIAFPILVVAVYATVSEERRPLALLALLFAGIYTAVLGAAYWLQLTTVPWNILRGATDGIAPWVVWNPASLFWSLETFGYFTMGVACVLVALAYEPGVLPRRARGGLLAMGPLGLFFLSTALKDVLLNPGEPAPAWVTVWSLSAALVWVVLFGFVSLSLARWFARSRTTMPATPPKSTTATTKG